MIVFQFLPVLLEKTEKAIIELHKNRKTFVFIKIPITESSKELVKNEIETLNLLQSFEFNKMIVPKLLDRNENSIAEIGEY